MNEDIIKGKWKEVKGQLRQKFSELTDDDIGAMQGTNEELVGRLQKTYGYEKERAQKEVDNFIKENKWD